MKKLNWKIKGVKLPDDWKWLKRLDFYIIKKFLGTYVFAIALIISIAVVFDFNEKMDRLSELHPLLCQFVQSAVRIYCRYLLYL